MTDHTPTRITKFLVQSLWGDTAEDDDDSLRLLVPVQPSPSPYKQVPAVFQPNKTPRTRSSPLGRPHPAAAAVDKDNAAPARPPSTTLPRPPSPLPPPV